MTTTAPLHGLLIRAALAALLQLPLLLTLPAAADALATLPDRLAAGTVNADLRLRHEYLHLDDPLPAAITFEEANATTLRVRLGYTTAAWNDLDAQLEYEGVETIGDDGYNSFNNGRGQYPAIPDAQVHEVNQAWLRWVGLPKTSIKAGRQRINLDNQRYIGGVAWRQDEQTFDGVSAVTTAIPRTTLTYAHLDQVNSFRHFTVDGRSTDTVDIDAHLANAAVDIAGARLKLVGYGYFLDFGRIANGPITRLMANTQTWGLRASGSEAAGAATLGWTLECAVQQDWRGGPQNDSRYGLAEASLGWRRLKAVLGYEVLGGDGVASFQTPLGTVHAFDGWADQFLITPQAGLKRAYAQGSAAFGKTALTAIWHDFSSDFGGDRLGGELNLLASHALRPNLIVYAKWASYFADAFPVVAGQPTDVQRGWVYAEFRF